MTEEYEVIIAQEQDAVNKPIHLGLEKEVEGTLILTNKRLIFACGEEKEESLQIEIDKEERLSQKIKDEIVNLEEDMTGIGGPITYSEVEDLKSITPDPGNIFISISSITSVTGHKGLIGLPDLKLSWKDGDEIKTTEFQEVLSGPSRARNLSDWAEVIEGLKSGSIETKRLPNPPSKDTLDGKIAYIMGDMQDKGVVEIEEQVESQFKLDLDPEEVEMACNRLVEIGYLDKITDESGDDFYRKRSPIGLDDLSS